MPNVKTIDTADAARAVDNIRLTVRGLLAVREMTALELAKILGLNRTPIYDRLRGVKPFTTEEVALMSTLFDLPVQVFFDGPGGLFEAHEPVGGGGRRGHITGLIWHPCSDPYAPLPASPFVHPQGNNRVTVPLLDVDIVWVLAA